MANGIREEDIDHRPHEALDEIHKKLDRIDHTLLNMMINQGKTIREAELEETVERQRNELAGAYRIIEGLKKDIRPHYSTSLLTADRTELMATIYKKNDLFPDTDILSLEKSGKAFMEWLIPSTSRPFRRGITKAILEYDDLALVENSHQKIYQCGGSNSYTSIKVGVASHKEMTTTIRTNLQDISNGNPQIEQYGRMWGNWIKKNADSYFLSGLFKALTEGYNDK